MTEIRDVVSFVVTAAQATERAVERARWCLRRGTGTFLGSGGAKGSHTHELGSGEITQERAGAGGEARHCELCGAGAGRSGG